jgi:hypothetical protein
LRTLGAFLGPCFVFYSIDCRVLTGGKGNNMGKIALFIGICGALTVAGRLRVNAETGDSADAPDEIRQLKEQILALDERIEFIEKRLEDGTIIKLRGIQPDALTFRVPGIIPRQQRLPKGSVRREFNGIPFYTVPINQDAK